MGIGSSTFDEPQIKTLRERWNEFWAWLADMWLALKEKWSSLFGSKKHSYQPISGFLNPDSLDPGDDDDADGYIQGAHTGDDSYLRRPQVTPVTFDFQYPRQQPVSAFQSPQSLDRGDDDSHVSSGAETAETLPRPLTTHRQANQLNFFPSLKVEPVKPITLYSAGVLCFALAGFTALFAMGTGFYPLLALTGMLSLMGTALMITAYATNNEEKDGSLLQQFYTNNFRATTMTVRI